MCFLFFWKFPFFRLLWKGGRGGGQKIAQNEKWQLHLLHAISQEQYSTWSWFLVHLCKMIISPCVSFIFSKFWFFVLLGGSKGKKWSKMTKISVCHTLYLETIYMIFIYGAQCMYKRIISPGIFFNFFFKILSFRIIRRQGW